MEGRSSVSKVHTDAYSVTEDVVSCNTNCTSNRIGHGGIYSAQGLSDLHILDRRSLGTQRTNRKFWKRNWAHHVLFIIRIENANGLSMEPFDCCAVTPVTPVSGQSSDTKAVSIQ